MPVFADAARHLQAAKWNGRETNAGRRARR